MTLSRRLVFSFSFLVLAAVGAPSEPAAVARDEAAIRRETTPPLLSLYLPIPLDVPRVEAHRAFEFRPRFGHLAEGGISFAQRIVRLG